MEQSIRDKMIALSEKILSLSRNELYLSMRFLDVALNSLEYELYLKTKTIGTDGEKILYNPRYLMDEYKDSKILVNRAYMHMLLHCMLRHVTNEIPYEKELYDLSCDIVVESILDSMEFPSVKRIVSDERRELYERLGRELKVLTPQGICRVFIKERLGINEQLRLEAIFRVDDHSIWDDLSDREKDKDNQNRNDQQQQDEEWEKKTEKVATNLKTFARNVGDMAGTLLTQLNVSTSEKVSYTEFIKKFSVLQEEMKVDEDSFDYIYYAYGLNHYKNMPFIEPLEYKEERKVDEFVIVLDTSGSCSGNLIKRFLKTTYDILSDEQSFANERSLFIIQCDAAVQDVVKITSLKELDAYMEQFEVKGHGGTDFRPAFTYIEQLQQQRELTNLKGMLYFTDGYGTYPTVPTPYETVFVFLGEEHYDEEVPPWAMKLVIYEEELAGGSINEY